MSGWCRQEWTGAIISNYNKALEVNIGRQEEWVWFDLRLAWDRKRDHAGFHFDIEVLGYYFYFKIYDGRHWNYKEDRWYKSNEETEERM